MQNNTSTSAQNALRGMRNRGLKVLLMAALLSCATAPAFADNSIDRYSGGPYRFGVPTDPGQGFVASTYRYNYQNYVEGDAGTRLGIHEWNSAGNMIYKLRGYGKTEVDHSKLWTQAACGNSDFDQTRIRDCHTLFYFYRRKAAALATPSTPTTPVPDLRKPPGCGESSDLGIAECWAEWGDYTPPADTWVASDPVGEVNWQEQTTLRFGFEIESAPVATAGRLTLNPVEGINGNNLLAAFETTYGVGAAGAAAFPKSFRMFSLPVDYSRAILAARGTTGMQLWAAPGSNPGTVCLLAVSPTRRYGDCASRALALKNGVTLAFSDEGPYTVAGFIRRDAQTVQLDGQTARVTGGFFILNDVSPKALSRPVVGLNAAGKKVAAITL